MIQQQLLQDKKLLHYQRSADQELQKAKFSSIFYNIKVFQQKKPRDFHGTLWYYFDDDFTRFLLFLLVFCKAYRLLSNQKLCRKLRCLPKVQNF